MSIASLLIYTSKFSALLLLENMKRQKTDCFTISYADAFLVFLEGEDSWVLMHFSFFFFFFGMLFGYFGGVLAQMWAFQLCFYASP